MRHTLAVLLAIGAFAAPASAVVRDVDPRSLVLRSSDVPKGFALDRDETGLRTNESEGKTKSGAALIARFGRVTGYEAEWDGDRGLASIVSRADVFRTPAGARGLLRLSTSELRASGIKGLRRTAVGIGDEGYVFHGGPHAELAWVQWRSGRVTGSLAGWGVTRDVLVRLARTQQRRIAAALR